MNSKENKINIEVKVDKERVAFPVPFSEQDSVRMIEAEIRLKIKELRTTFPNKRDGEILAMATYNYASAYYYLARKCRMEIEEAELLLDQAERLLGDAPSGHTDDEPEEFDVY